MRKQKNKIKKIKIYNLYRTQKTATKVSKSNQQITCCPNIISEPSSKIEVFGKDENKIDIFKFKIRQKYMRAYNIKQHKTNIP